MNGKQAKKSRNLQRALSKATDKKISKIERAKQIDRAQTISDYNLHLLGLPLNKRIRFSFKLIFLGKHKK